MKRILFLASLLVVTVVRAQSGPTAVERGPHHAVWRTVTATLNEVGKLVSETNSFVEVATGLNFWNPATQEWEESQEKFEITPAGHAIAVKGQCQLMLAADINSGGSVDLLIQDDKRFISNSMGLSFFDSASGKKYSDQRGQNLRRRIDGAKHDFVSRRILGCQRSDSLYVYENRHLSGYNFISKSWLPRRVGS